MQPENLKEVNTDDEFTSFMQDNVDEDKPIKEQIQKLLKEMFNARRKSAKNFYNKGYEYGMFGTDVAAPVEDE